MPPVVDRQTELETRGSRLEGIAAFADNGVDTIDLCSRDDGETIAFANVEECLQHGLRELTRGAEKALNPLIGKSLVVYLHKAGTTDAS